MSSTTLSTIQPTEQLDPLETIYLFLCSQKLSITHLVSDAQDTTMKLLYKIAINNVQQLLGEEGEKTKGIKAIYDNTQVQLEKIKNCIQNDKKENLQPEEDVTSIPETPALKYLNNKHIEPKEYSEAHYNKLKELVEQFRNERSRRASWKQCFLKGHRDNIDAIKRYNTSESLRSQYNKHFK